MSLTIYHNSGQFVISRETPQSAANRRQTYGQPKPELRTLTAM
jgi:hypothetical protein